MVAARIDAAALILRLAVTASIPTRTFARVAFVLAGFVMAMTTTLARSRTTVVAATAWAQGSYPVDSLACAHAALRTTLYKLSTPEFFFALTRSVMPCQDPALVTRSAQLLAFLRAGGPRSWRSVITFACVTRWR